MVIPVAHDFVCEWCWIGLHQAKRLKNDFGAKIEWRGYEIYPEGIEAEPNVEPPPAESQPIVPSRLTLAFAAAGIEPVRRPAVNTHAAHEAVEFAKLEGAQDALVERIYYAYWKDGDDISDVGVLQRLAKGLISDFVGFSEAIQQRRFEKDIISFNQAAHETGIWHVPTFWIGGERYAEQPWSRLRKALAHGETAPDFYTMLEFPTGNAPAERPYIIVNMVATIDGKIVTGNRGEPVQDLGSETDHVMMRRIQSAAEGVLIGAGAQRSSDRIWYPKELFRFVATQSGNVLSESRFFTDVPERAFVLCPESASISTGLQTIRCGEKAIDWGNALELIRSQFEIRRLLVEGGSEINAQLLRLGLVDELFLTVAPKIKLGADTPTYADGEPLPRELVQQYSLVEEHRWGDEVFLRYRRR